MDGMFPIGNGFQAPGYAPVSGITYNVHPPPLGCLNSGSSVRGGPLEDRRLFKGYTSMVEPGLPDLSNAVHHPGLQALLQDVRIHPYALFIPC